jgi:hypothetical protein
VVYSIAVQAQSGAAIWISYAEPFLWPLESLVSQLLLRRQNESDWLLHAVCMWPECSNPTSSVTFKAVSADHLLQQQEL